MTMTLYSNWDSKTKDVQRIRPLLPLFRPPYNVEAPRNVLPARPPKLAEPFAKVEAAASLDDWSLSTHIYPAAWPRTRVRSAQSRQSKDQFLPKHLELGKVRDKSKLQSETEWLFQHQEADGWTDANDLNKCKDEETLWIAANRYSRKRSTKDNGPRKTGYTLISAHATGLHKETWEPLLGHLLSTSSSELVDEIWSIDCVNQGDSSLLNRSKLGDTFSWPDNGRDVANFILNYLPEYAEGLNVPFVLCEQPSAAVQEPRLWRNRKIIGCGHSLGGAAVTYAASAIPEVFDGMAYLDPILPPYSQRYRNLRPITMGAIARRDTWFSFDEAYKAMKSKKNFFGKWNDAVLQRYLYCAMYESKSPEGKPIIQLKARKQDEALVFADPLKDSGEQNAGARLSSLPASLFQRMLFVHPDIGQSVFPESALKEMIDAAPGSHQVRLDGVGHLIVQEAPLTAAQELAKFLFRLEASGNRPDSKPNRPSL